MVYYGMLIITVFIFVMSSFMMAKMKKILKYMPGIISLIFGAVNLYLARSETGIILYDRTALVLICSVGFLSGIFTSLYIDILLPKIKNKRVQ